MPDAIVVGAGLSGLVCATRLVAAGVDAVVVEARDRVGGRLETGAVGGATVDLGGQWMSVGQPRLAALAAELGVASFPQRRDGRHAIALATRGWLAQIGAAFAQWRAIRTIRRLAIAVPDDADSLAGWLDHAVPNPTARALIGLHASLVFAVEPEDLALAGYLQRLAVTGDFAPRGPELPGGGREHRFVGGAQELALRLAGSLGGRVVLGAPVRAIVETADAIRVDERTARRVVLALPPHLARAIAGLPPDAAQVGSVVKCFAAYDRAFWRDAGLSGEGYHPGADVRATVGLESPDGGPAVVLAFVVGRAARGWAARDPEARRASVLATLVAQFGDAAATPIAYREVDWGVDPWSGGCVASVPPGARGTPERAPRGRIHFAGTETAVAWPGYMEGAIEAGERAAAEVVAAL